MLNFAADIFLDVAIVSLLFFVVLLLSVLFSGVYMVRKEEYRNEINKLSGVHISKFMKIFLLCLKYRHDILLGVSFFLAMTFGFLHFFLDP